MSVPPRGAKNRRDASRPGWQLLTALLVLAIVASATLVFTNKVELLRLAVILSLWAAVLAAFVTVIYRRQSESDQARARDMKYVYDLQLDREIAARREYELSVEAHLRRQLSQEVRAQAADEMAALRAELASLRTHLEVLLGADLGDRPALEFDRAAEPVSMVMPPPPGRVESSRVTVVEEVTVQETIVEETVVESPIIDVPEEPLAPPPPPPPPVRPVEYRGGSHRRVETIGVPPTAPPAPPPPPTSPAPPPPPPPPPVTPPPVTPWRPPEAEPRRGRHWTPEAGGAPAARGRHWVDEAQPPVEPSAATVPDDAEGQHTGGQSVAELIARLQGDRPSGGGGRRRRED